MLQTSRKVNSFYLCWTVGIGNGNLTTYQSLVTPTSIGSSVFLSNTNTTSVSRFISPNTTSLAAGIYKLTFKTRGKVKWGSITLTESTVSLTSSTATTATTKNLFPTTGIVTEDIPAGTGWTTKEYTFGVTVAGLYRVIFWPTSNVAALVANQDNFFLIDDVVLQPFADNTICTLSELRVKGSMVDNFSASNLNYTLTLPNTVTIPPVTVLATDSRSTIAIVNATNLSGTEAERTATITVTATDGVTQKVYKVIFTMTSDLIREGFASTDLPSAYTFSNAGADWRIDATTTNSNGLIWGMNSLRANGGTIGGTNTTGYFTINNIENSGILSFYLKQREVDAAGKLTVLYQYTTDPVDQWTELVNYTTFPLAYELKSIELNKTAAINLKFDVIKTSGVSPFNLDDIVMSAKSISSISNNLFSRSIHITDVKTGINIHTQGFAKYSISTITG